MSRTTRAGGRKGMSEADVLGLIEQAVKDAGSAMCLARRWDVSTQYLCDVRRRRRGLTSRILTPLGLVAFIDYRRMKPVKPVPATRE